MRLLQPKRPKGELLQKKVKRPRLAVKLVQLKKKPREKALLGVMVPLDPFVVNLSGTQGKRFLKVALTLELSSSEVNAEVIENLQKIIDSILILLSSKTFEDVYSIQGKFTLKGEITARANQFLTKGQVKGAYFTEFIIQ